MIMLESSLRLMVFFAAGLVLREHMLSALLLALALMGFGLYVGHRIHPGVSQPQLLKMLGLLLTATGLSLICRSDLMAGFL